MRIRFIALGIATLLTLTACGPAETATDSPEAPVEVVEAEPEAIEAEVEPESETEVEEIAESEAVPQLLSGAFGPTLLSARENLATESARFQALITMIPGPGAGFDSDLTISFAGAFNAQTGDSEMTLDWGNFMAAAMAAEGSDGAIPEEFAALFTEPMQIKIIGDKSYMKWSFFSMFFGTDKWIEGDASEAETMTEGFGFGTDGGSPIDLLDALYDANAEVELIGNEMILDTQTTHYRALLNIEDFAKDLSPEERAELESEVGDLGAIAFPIDVWIGEDGNVYRYSLVIDSAVAGSDLDEFESMTMTFDMWDYGADIVIEPPPADDIASEDELGFNLDGFDL